MISPMWILLLLGWVWLFASFFAANADAAITNSCVFFAASILCTKD